MLNGKDISICMPPAWTMRRVIAWFYIQSPHMNMDAVYTYFAYQYTVIFLKIEH